MTNTITPTTQTFDHLVYIRVFEGCNLHCKHCFIPANPKKMDLDLLAKVPDILAQKIPLGSTVLIQWHGGEPTLLGADFLNQAIQSIEKDKRFQWKHGIQTNLITYNEDWSGIYKKYFNNEVGVSWDEQIRTIPSGPEELRFKKFEEKFWPQFHKLLADGLNPYLIVTGTKIFFERFSNPMEWFELMTERGVTHAHIERLTKTGYARKTWEEIGLSNLEYSQYMSRWYKAYKLWNETNPERRIALSPFDGLEISVKNLNESTTGYGCWSGTCDTHFHTIDANGYKAGCTALTSEEDNPRHQGEVVIQFVKNHKDFVLAREKRQAPCESCTFRPICNTGCLATEKMDESGECSGAYKLFDTIKKFA